MACWKKSPCILRGFSHDSSDFMDVHGMVTRPGKHTNNYGKSPFLVGKSTINCHFKGFPPMFDDTKSSTNKSSRAKGMLPCIFQPSGRECRERCVPTRYVAKVLACSVRTFASGTAAASTYLSKLKQHLTTEARFTKTSGCISYIYILKYILLKYTIIN